MIPDLVDGRLPAGEWAASWEEIEAAFAASQWRRHPALLDLSPGRPEQIAEFGCEFFPNVVEAGSGAYFVQFFQRDRDGRPKGIVIIDLIGEEFGP